MFMNVVTEIWEWSLMVKFENHRTNHFLSPSGSAKS